MSEFSDCPADCPPIAAGPSGQPAEHRFVAANGLRFHTVQMGSGPLVLLLHGFPEFWYGWRRQLPALAEQCRAVAPDLRGYNLTDRPRSGYSLRHLVADVAALIPALGAERAQVVGHDWGGAIAWCLAMWAPERVEKLAIINAPHPAAFLRELRRNRRQQLKSWYIGFFQLPFLPEWLLGRDECRPIADALRRTALTPDAFSASDLAAYRRAAGRPGALSAMLAYYRALARIGLRGVDRSVRPIAAPSLVIWGEQDPALVPELAEGLERWVPNLRVVRVPEASHWVQHEQPDLVNAELRAFLGG